MASEDSVFVSIAADASGVPAGVDAAQTALDDGVAAMTSSVEQLASSTKGAAEESASAFESIGEAAKLMGEGVTEGVAMAQEGLEGLEARIGGLQKLMGTLAEVAVAGFIGEQVIDLAKDFGEYAEQLTQASEKTGMTTEDLQKLNFAAQMNGVSSGQMEQGMIRLSRAVLLAEEGSKQTQGTFASLGISMEQLKDLPLEQVMDRIADKFSTWEDGAAKTGIAIQLLGRAGAGLIPVLNGGSAALQEYGERASQLGLIMDEAMIEKGEQANRSFKELGAVTAMLKLQVGAELAPALANLADTLVRSYQEGGSLKTVLEGVDTTIQTVEVLVNTLAGTFEELRIRISGATDALKQWAGNAAAAAANAGGANLGFDTTNVNAQTDQKLRTAQYAEQTRNLMFLNPATYAKGANQDQVDRLGGAPPIPQLTQPPVQDTTSRGGIDQVAVWKEQLQEQEEASNDFFKSNLAQEAAFWQGKLALVKTGSKDWMAVMHELYSVHKEMAQQDLADDLASIREQIGQEQEGSLQRVALAQQAADQIGSAYGQLSKEYASAMAEVNRMAQQYVQQQVKDQDDAIRQQEQVALGQVKVDEEQQKQLLAQHKETTQQELANLIDLENQRYTIMQQAVTHELAISAGIPAMHKELLAEQLKDEEEHAAAVAKLNEESAADYQKTWDDAFNRIDGTLTSALMGMMKGTETFTRAMSQVAGQVTQAFIKMGVDVLSRWVETELMRTAASVQGAAARESVTLAESSAGMAQWASRMLAYIAGDAAVAFAGTTANLAPFLGPAAVGPAEAVEASVMSVGGMINAYEGGGWQIPQRQLAMLHTNEMVLPSWGAEGIRNLISSGGAQASTPNVSINYQPNLGGVLGAQAFGAMLAQHSDQVMDAVYTALRNFRKF